MNFTDVPKLPEWLKATQRLKPTPSSPGLTGRELYMSKIDKLIERYHQVMQMAKYHTLLDLRQETANWKSAPKPMTVTKASNFLAQVSLQDAFKALEEVVERKINTYPRRKYEQIVLAGYCIKTGETKPWIVGGKNYGTAAGYMGDNDPLRDVELRCEQMKQAIKAAVSLYQTRLALSNQNKLASSEKIRDDRKTLKLFMAPEFFFRGKAGAYTLDLMMGYKRKSDDKSTDDKNLGVLDRLRKETCLHTDWLFVLGTFVIGSEDTGVGCFNHSPGKRMVPGLARWQVRPVNVLTCPQCKAQLWCNNCKELLTVNASRKFSCPKCNQNTNFEEKVISVIIDNYAMVQKGGFTRGDGINDYCMEKRLVSNLDFEHRAGDSKVNIFGAWQKRSEPPVGGASERMGGGVFTMDGITFGMEICLDHSEKRLKNDPERGNIQIQLIPSAGMDIHQDSVACVSGGLLFNVDGGRGDATVKVNKGAFAPEPTKGTKPVNITAAGCFPAGNQRIDLFGPFDIAYQ